MPYLDHMILIPLMVPVLLRSPDGLDNGWRVFEIEAQMKISTVLTTWFKGILVGKDIFSNRYYRSKGATLNMRERRWVLYKGGNDASSVPPEWHAWLHHTCAAPLTERAAVIRAWQKEHQPNRTGTVNSYLPSGHDSQGGRRAAATGDYQAWTPDQS